MEAKNYFYLLFEKVKKNYRRKKKEGADGKEKQVIN